MLRARTPGRLAAPAVAAVVIIGSAGCANRVKQEAFDTEIASLRAEVDSQVRHMAQRVDSLDQRTANLQRELAEMREQFTTQITENEQALTFNVPVHFEFDDATLREEDRPVLDRFAQVVNRHYGAALVTVEGFADPAGDAAYNLWLGEQRAQAVREYLAQAGLAGDRVKVVSYGEAQNRQVVPGAQGPGQEGMENRRVALVIDYSGNAGEGVANTGEGGVTAP